MIEFASLLFTLLPRQLILLVMRLYILLFSFILVFFVNVIHFFELQLTFLEKNMFPNENFSLQNVTEFWEDIFREFTFVEETVLLNKSNYFILQNNTLFWDNLFREWI